MYDFNFFLIKVSWDEITDIYSNILSKHMDFMGLLLILTLNIGQQQNTKVRLDDSTFVGVRTQVVARSTLWSWLHQGIDFEPILEKLQNVSVSTKSNWILNMFYMFKTFLLVAN